MQKLSFIVFLAVFAFGCDPADEKQTRNDSGTPDLGTDMKQNEDSGRLPDLSDDMKTDTTQDMAQRDMAQRDMASNHAVAVLNERCTPKERVGLVTVERGVKLNVGASLYDAPSPTIDEPALSDAQCSFYNFESNPPCANCETEETCNVSGVCVPRPNLATDGTLEISNGMESKSIITENGSLSDSIELNGNDFSMEVSWAGQTITLPSMKLPEALNGLNGKLEGGYDSPDALDFTWDAPAVPARVFTHIPMNHHVAKPAFTECDVDAASGTLHVEGTMLKPLSLVTGLEFQTLNHVRFAAAQTQLGCVEFRFQATNFPPL